MSKKIDLLPPELRTDSRIVSVARTLRYFSMIMVMFVFFIALGGFSLLYVKNNELRDLVVEKEALKKEVRSLASTEQRLILIKDRVDDIAVILDSRNSEKLFREQVKLVEAFSQNINYTKLEIEGNNSRLMVDSTSSKEMSDLFKRLIDADVYESVLITKLGFNFRSGYQFDLKIK